MKLLVNNEKEMEFEICFTELQMMVEQLLNFPESPCWLKGTWGSIKWTLHGVNNIGHE